MYSFILILIVITGNDRQQIVRHEHGGYPTYALCRAAREAKLLELAKRDDLNGLYADTCAIKL